MNGFYILNEDLFAKDKCIGLFKTYNQVSNYIRKHNLWQYKVFDKKDNDLTYLFKCNTI